MKLRALKLAALGAVAACALQPDGAQAQTVNPTVTVTVDNTLTLAVTQQMNFGKLVVFAQTGAGVAAVADISITGVLSRINGVGATDGRIEILDNTAANETIITIADGVPSATINVTVDNLVNPTDGLTALTLDIDSYQEDAAPPSTGAVTVATPFTVALDANGANTLHLGGTLTTVNGANYADAVYTGGYDVTFSY